MVQCAKYDDFVLLSTGRKLNAYGGVIGIDAHGAIYGGFDDRLPSEDWSDPGLTPEERRELADYMIERWQRFKHRAMKEGKP